MERGQLRPENGGTAAMLRTCSRGANAKSRQNGLNVR